MMNSIERFYPEVSFGRFTDVDGTVVFFNRVNSLLDSSFVVLDVGCGRGEYSEDPVPLRKNLRILRGKVAKVIGIDVDQSAEDNPFLDEFHLIKGDSWPLTSNSIDLIVCDHVLEHIAHPNRLILEMTRVLRNQGYLCIRTPNRWNYIALAATLIPNKYHAKVTTTVQPGRRKEGDVFPTVYKCNSVRKLRNLLETHGFECVVYGYEPEPGYLSFSKVAYFCGVVHQRVAPGFLKAVLFAFGRIRKNAA